MQSTNPETHKSDSTVFKKCKINGSIFIMFIFEQNGLRTFICQYYCSFLGTKLRLFWSIFNQLRQLQLESLVDGVLVFAHVKPQANTPRQGTNWPWKQEKQSETPSLAKNYFLNRTLFSSSVFHICYNVTTILNSVLKNSIHGNKKLFGQGKIATWEDQKSLAKL